MNRTAAEAWLKRATAWDSEPQLSQSDIDLLLDQFGGTSFSLRSLNAAAAEGWGWKANASSETYLSGEDKIYEHCKERQRYFASRASAGGSVVTAADTDAVKSLI